MDQKAKLRKLIVSTFALEGFTIQEKACAHLIQQLEPLECKEDRDQWLEKIIDYVRVSNTNDGNIVTYDLLNKSLKFCCDLQILNDEDILRVTPANKLPCYKYCSSTKKFLRITSDSKSLSMFGDASTKIAQYVNRYTVIRQRMTRIKTVTDGTLGQPLTISDKIRDVDYLLSSGAAGKFDHNSKKSSVLLLGILVQLKEGGRYYLEDPTGAIPIDLSKTISFENISEGCYCSDQRVFAVTDMALPPCERAEISKIYFGEATTFCDDDHSLKLYNPKLLEYEKTKKRMIIFICDVFLDDPKVLNKFHTFLNAFNEVIPVAIVMMGDFLSCHVPSHVYAQELKFHLTQLGHYLHDNTPELKNTTFVLLPGPGDRYCGTASASILPRPPIPDSLTEEFRRLVPRCVFTTNPCRIQYCTQQLHVIRIDGLMKKTANYDVRQGSVDRKKSTVAGIDKSAVQNYIQTLESQSHLITVPLDVCPTYWPLASHSLSLYPMPDLVCVADANAPEYSTSDDSSSRISSSSGCVFINPSSFARNKYRFSVYLTAQRQVDDSQIPDDDEVENNSLDV
ncbi:DNA polymerase epsilon, subunit B,DNA polymerase epsilon subunit B, N-terminal,DNA polymerase [Cinara cedri]|uniref:DNA polymerase epsilon subunit n=1 Tax=Cinara cedri TaxID=506608 RepID=A0A5E4MLN1_9HEMI|nr:DNA polymerase epsilon, subunit B,DNA polymerase epsilon subunit B, N-terminal,DNA polymerase [Cinara cedri]